MRHRQTKGDTKSETDRGNGMDREIESGTERDTGTDERGNDRANTKRDTETTRK